MANGCVNGTLDGADYSAPVPVIGLYIATGTLVCVLFMLSDVISAFRHRKKWIPCRLFSLNSLTLTLLAICTKLPVDLTTAMPGAHDQLSKLTATTLLCVAIGFMSPSLESRSASESLSNIIALSILVITVVVNMCIQIGTGVIQVFVVEHILVMCCMFVLLLFVWYSAIQRGDVRGTYISMDFLRRLIAKKDQGSMFRRLEVFYILGFALNPQMVVAMESDNFAVSGFCFLSSAVLVQATVRSLILKQQFDICEGTLDYGWSMPIIVTTQIIMVIVGCFALSIRYAGMFSQVDFSMNFRPPYSSRSLLLGLGGRFWSKCGLYLRYYVSSTVLYAVSTARIMSTFTAVVYFKYTGGERYRREQDSRGPDSLEKYRRMSGLQDKLSVLTTRKALSDIECWAEKSQSTPLTNLSQLLQRAHPSQQLCSEVRIGVSALSLALLVRIATVALPLDLTKSLLESFHEVYELVDFIEAALGSRDHKDTSDRKLAEALAFGDGFVSCLPLILEISSCGEQEFQSLSQFNCTLLILEHLKDAMGDPVLYFEVRRFTRLIKKRGHETVEEIYCFLEQLCVDILHSTLARLPEAIHKEAMECPAEEFEERVMRSLRILCKVESLDTQVQWIFPEGSNISRLMVDGSAEDDSISDVNPLAMTRSNIGDDIRGWARHLEDIEISLEEQNHLPFDQPSSI